MLVASGVLCVRWQGVPSEAGRGPLSEGNAASVRAAGRATEQVVQWSPMIECMAQHAGTEPPLPDSMGMLGDIGPQAGGADPPVRCRRLPDNHRVTQPATGGRCRRCLTGSSDHV